ncbi:Alpha/Beta hydrolase protein [Staphylotrichum tortipilum]|uniref:1-alkyl-2-acetylglycerophosphocholine esterase n=1 Tax=Staphylotrichum tortipilum TaxID=2831512 RepID=A0AAN6MAA4_9PEZI|nr:Alpha/Beta hydrolase protein [Staphylotrichum longicolle]
MHFTLLAGLLLRLAQAVVVPSHAGPFWVTMRVKALTDHSRTDPLNKTVKRQVLLSVFSPVSDSTKCSSEIIAYMPPATAASYGALAQSAGLPADIFSSFQLELCKLSDAQHGSCRGTGRAARFPLVLFSPGLAESRLLYSVTAKSIAAQGYVVVTIDHPYDTDVVEFPDGSVVRSNGTVDGMEQRLTEIRAADMSFVLSQLLQLSSSANPLFHNLPAKIDFNHVIAMGHSLGGAAAAQVLPLDKRILGGIDMDGRLFNPVLKSGMKQPFLLLGREKHADEDATWNSFWEVLRGPKAMVGVAGTTHASFTDIPALIQSLGLPAEAQSRVEELLGTVGGSRMQEIVAGICSSFFTSVFTGKYRRLLDTVQGFPEVSVRNSSLKAI